MLRLVTVCCVFVSVAAVPGLATLVSVGGNLDGGFNTGLPYSVTSGQTFAASFVMPESIQFADAQLALVSYQGQATPTVYLETDNSGAPGTILEALVPTGSFSQDGSVVTFDCSSCPVLTAGDRYWIVAADPTGISGWGLSDSGYFPGETQAYSYVSSSGPWTAFSGSSAAFQVDADTPEPGSVALVGLAAAAMLFRLRTRVA